MRKKKIKVGDISREREEALKELFFIIIVLVWAKRRERVWAMGSFSSLGCNFIFTS